LQTDPGAMAGQIVMPKMFWHGMPQAWTVWV
jgi:hypothetical protein